MAEVQRPRPARRFIRQYSPKPLITYGKKNTTPLISLTGSQFRSSIFDLPLDEGHVEKVQSEKARRVSPINSREPSQDSELSDAEPLPPKQTRETGAEAILEHISPSEDRQSNVSKSDKRRSKPRPTKASTSALPAVKKVKSKAARKAKTAPRQNQSVQRRLPVNELFLVPSPVDYTVADVRPSSPFGIDIQDPIADPSSSPSRANKSSPASKSSGVSNHRPRGNLSTIQARLKPRRSIFKQINRVKHERKSNLVPRGDGFDNSELRIVDIPRVRGRPKPKSPSMLAFAELQLTDGPLPETQFEHPELQFDMANENGDAAARKSENNVVDGEDDDFTAMPVHESAKTASRSSGIRAQQIMAQLSSISAPARPRSDSGASNRDSEAAEEEEEEDDDAMEDDDQHTEHDGDNMMLNTSLPRPSPPGRHQGVLQDFSYLADSNSNAKRPSILKRPALVEVDESIVEVLDSGIPRVRRTLTQKINGNAETLDPILESSGQHVTDTRHPPQNDSAAVARPAPTRTRSILKNSTPIVIDSSTHPESTASNTRRNSIVETSTSRYFSDTVNLLAAPDPSRHTIVPRRRSAYLCDEWVDVLDTDAVVPETSPHQRGYVAESSLSVLRKTGDEIWASNVANVPKDLKSLTRSVSREHGTLSQAVRRRPSRPFQSPTKVR